MFWYISATSYVTLRHLIRYYLITSANIGADMVNIADIDGPFAEP